MIHAAKQLNDKLHTVDANLSSIRAGDEDVVAPCESKETGSRHLGRAMVDPLI